MYPKKFFEDSNVVVHKSKCFVIMPFAEEFGVVYESIQECVEGDSLDFECERADELTRGGHILEDILRGVGEAEIVIADLTGRNPNVFYELGVAHIVKDVDKIIMISQKIEDIPFDLRPYRCITYEQTINGIKELQTKIINSIKSVTHRAFRFNLKRNENFKFPRHLMGSDRYMYSLEITESYFGYEDVKFKMIITKHGFDDPDEIIFNKGFAVLRGEKRQLLNIGWELKLEGVNSDEAKFVLIHL